MNIIKLVIVLFFLIVPASAVTINNSHHVYQITNANITFPTNQTYDSIEIGADYIMLDGSRLKLTPTNYVNITINQFSTTTNLYNISLNGSSGVDFEHTVPTPGDYQFIKDGVLVGTVTTAGNILSGTITASGNNTVIWNLIVLPALTVVCNHTNDELISSLYILTLLAFVVGAVLLFVGFRTVDTKLMLAGTGVIIAVIIVALFGIAIVSRMGIC